MATVLAIQLTDKETKFLTARAEPGARISVLGVSAVPIQPADASDEEQSETPSESLSSSAFSPPGFLDETEIDSTLGVIHSSKILYNVLELPFRDKKKIEQVAGYQIQDILPFDLDDFVLDSIVSSETEDKKFRIVSSMLPKEEVARSLELCNSFGTEPRVLTTGAAALASLAEHCSPQNTGLVAYLDSTSGRVSLAVLCDGAVFHLRDFLPPVREQSAEDTAGHHQELLQNIACSLAQASREAERPFNAVCVVGRMEYFNGLREHIPVPFLPLDLSRIVVNDSPQDIEMNDIAWSLGLVASEINRSRKSDRRLLDFRQGAFAFHRAWQDIWNALQGELFYIILVIMLGIGWYGGKIYSGYAALNDVDEQMSQLIKKVLPQEDVPFHAEVSFLQNKLDSLQDELQGLGSLASLSPLEALNELTIAIGNGMDISLDSVNIGASHMILRGSVGENLLVADLSAALKAHHDHFCDVKVDNKGKTGNSRVGFTAEITLCD
jgi:hypothetical protein